MTQGATTTTTFDCGDVDRLLGPYLDDEFGDDDRASLESHLSACAPCRARAASAMAVRSALRARLREAFAPGAPHATAPDSLRRRISAALDAEAEERPVSWWRRIVAPLPVAAMAACVAGVLVVLAGHRATDPLVEEAVRKHARDLPL
jgi:anti-sigma factor RsiW